MPRRVGLGPWVVGLLSDWLTPSYGEESIRWALAIALSANVIGAFCYWQAARSYAEDLKLKDVA